MVHRIKAALLAATGLLALGASARAELDLTPRERQVSFEGVPYAQVAFENGHDLVTYGPPAGWKLQGGGAKVELRPEGITFASASIEARRRPADGVLDGAVLQKLQAEIAASLPREAESVKWEEIEVNPLLLNRHETRRLTVSYAAFTQRFTITVVVCHFAQQQILFRLDARSDDFPRQYDLFRRSLFSWQGLP